MSDRARPTIGITGPDRGGGAAWLFTRLAVTMAGATAVRITPSHPVGIEVLDGLIIGGGADVGPHLYGEIRLEQEADGQTGTRTLTRALLDAVIFPLTWLVRRLAERSNAAGVDPARDTLELKLLSEAIERRLPVLGICRGEQLLNVFFGGTLHQELGGFYTEDPEVRSILPRKRIIITPGTLLARILGTKPTRVNALHRQGVASLGTGLLVCARDRNNIVQAIEHERFQFLLGIQWHPEYLPQVREQRRIFKELVSEAARRRGERTFLTADDAPGVSP